MIYCDVVNEYLDIRNSDLKGDYLDNDDFKFKGKI
jgi:hypothetical protein